MNYNHITQAYQNAERQALEEMNDPHLIVLTMFDALLKSMHLFEGNIDIRNGGDSEVKLPSPPHSPTVSHSHLGEMGGGKASGGGGDS